MVEVWLKIETSWLNTQVFYALFAEAILFVCFQHSIQISGLNLSCKTEQRSATMLTYSGYPLVLLVNTTFDLHPLSLFVGPLLWNPTFQGNVIVALEKLLLYSVHLLFFSFFCINKMQNSACLGGLQLYVEKTFSGIKVLSPKIKTKRNVQKYFKN